MSKQKLIWKKQPEPGDYAGALKFLMLIYADSKARRLLRGLSKSKNVEHAAKDLLRASNLPLLPREEAHVEEDLTRIRKGKSLAPVLLRICAICYYDENAPIPCRLASAR
jgi:hypothetical protein